jgi:ATP-dependent DNA helicase RecG
MVSIARRGEGDHRKSVKLLPQDSIRELVANALIHLSMGGASPMIEIYSNRIEISNPGEPIVPVERFIDGYQSRNERLADFIRRMSICEEKSSGIDRVVHQAEAFQLPAPDFRAGYRRTITIVYGPKPFEEMDREDRVRACYQHCRRYPSALAAAPRCGRAVQALAADFAPSIRGGR